MVQWWITCICLIFSLMFSLNSWATTHILDVRLMQQGHHTTRLVFDMSEPVTHRLFTLSDPNRLVIDLKNTQLNNPVLKPPAHHPVLKKIRTAARQKHDLRVVLDLKAPVRTKSFSLKPSGRYGHRLVVDVDPLLITTTQVPPQRLSIQQHSAPPSRLLTAPTLATEIKPAKIKPASHKRGKRDVIVAIDAGHGGIDPGAIGKNGTYEKDVVLAIAKELAQFMQKEPGMYPVMIRKDDYYLKLRKRIELARQYKADLFISIHADALPDGRIAKGSSVYMLSQKGASSEAVKWLAKKENSADLLGGISLNDKDDVLASVLLDLSQTGTLEASAYAAEKMVSALGQVTNLHYRKVQHAAFMVLRSPDIPSVLIETAFISNPVEEKRLKTPQYQKKIAKAILNGAKAYFNKYAPPDTVLAKN